MIAFDQKRPRGLVWLASYPKSGNTWLRAFLYALDQVIRGHAPAIVDVNEVARFGANERAAALYEFYLQRPISQVTQADIAAVRPKVQEDICRSGEGLVFVKTHNAMGHDHGHPLINRRVSAGAIYIVRNPLDVALSYAHYRKVSVDAIIADMATSGFGALAGEGQIHYCCGTWSDHVASWTARASSPVLVVRYEDLLKRPLETFGRIALHVGLKPTGEQLQKAVGLTDFRQLRSAEDRTGFIEKPDAAAQFFRAGRAGEWREGLSTAQIHRVVNDHRTQMARFGYLPD